MSPVAVRAEPSFRSSSALDGEVGYRMLPARRAGLMWSIDADAMLVLHHPEVLRDLTGYEAGDLEGVRYRARRIPALVALGDEILRRAKLGQTEFACEITMPRKDGVGVRLKVEGIARVGDDGNLRFACGTADEAEASERSRLEERFVGNLHELAALAIHMNSQISVEMVVDSISTKAREMLDAQQLFTSTTVGPAWSQRVVVASPWGVELPDGCELATIPCETGRPLRRTSEDMRAHVAICRAHARMLNPHARGGWLVVPLTRQNGANVGLIQAFGREHRDFDEEDEALLLQLAQLASAALARAQLLGEVERYANALEERVAERTAELVEINASLEAFAYSVSHDLRMPLQAVNGFAEALSDQCSLHLDPDVRSYPKRIVAATERMAQLIQDLLDFSRIGRGEARVELLSLDDIVQRAMSQIEPAWFAQTSTGNQPNLTIDVSSLEVLGHGPTLVQAVVNLVSNAAKFVAPGVEPRVRIWAEERGDIVRLWVADNGIGIPYEARDRIFEPFHRVDGVEHPGSGIGLAIVKRAVTSVGGSVGMESSPGSGSAFWLELPRAVSTHAQGGAS